MMKTFPNLSLAFGVLLAVFQVACAGTPDSFYRLTSEAGLKASSAGRGGKVVGLGPVKLPDYIDRAELVFQSDTHRFEVPPEHRWAGDLQENISEVLAANLDGRLDSATVMSYPWSSGPEPVYSIPVTIRQFHAVSGGDAILDARWEVRQGSAGKIVSRGAQVFTEGLGEEGYDGVVAAESRLLGQLAAAIAGKIP